MQLRFLHISGPDVEPATVDFQPGLNVINGPSNTGKSYILRLIDYMLGARDAPEPIAEQALHDLAHLGIMLDDGTEKTLVRALAGGEIRVFDGLTKDRPADKQGVAMAARDFALNIVFVTLVSDVVILLVAAPAAYVLASKPFPGQKLVFALFMVGMVLPPQIALTSLFQLLKSLDILNTRWALILPYIAFFMPLPIFVMRGFFMELPRELSEAAAVDGASSAQTFLHILLPLTRPIVVSLAVLNFVWIWNEFLFALSFIYTNELRTIPAGLFTFVSRQFSNLGAMAAGVVLSILPILVIYLIFQRQIVRGLVAGALK